MSGIVKAKSIEQVRAIAQTVSEFKIGLDATKEMLQRYQATTQELGHNGWMAYVVVTSQTLAMKYDRDHTNPRVVPLSDATRFFKDGAETVAAITFNGRNERAEAVTMVEACERVIDNYEHLIATLESI